MTIFDELGKKITSVGEGAISKGKNIADSARLNTTISEEEKKINNLYLQIGKLYIALHFSDYESDFGNLVEAVASSEERIKNLKQQLHNIRGITICENCGAEVSNGSAFCSTCGSPMSNKSAVLDDDHIRCSCCGSIIDRNDRFCIHCGKPVTQSEIADDSTVDEFIQTETTDKIITASEEEQIINNDDFTCPSCGATTRAGLKFCTACGSSLEKQLGEENLSSSQVDDKSQVNEKICPSCGATLEKNMMFCIICGAKQSE